MSLPKRLAPVVFVVAACTRPHAPSPGPAPDGGAWIARSNQSAQLLLDVQARFQPEMAARTGVPGVDEQVSDLGPGHRERHRQALRQALVLLEQRREAERDPLVALDLSILVDDAKRQLRGSELQQRLLAPYYPLPRMIFGSIRGLLDPQVARERRPAALVRVRKYAGLAAGTTPIVELAIAETRAGLEAGLLAPSRLELENDLETSGHLVEGIQKLFRDYAVPGWEEPVGALVKQLDAYQGFVRTELLPKARRDFRLPAELYQFRLDDVGVDIPAAELAERAHRGFAQIQSDMQEVAARVAKQRGLASSDYRDVIRELKKEQIPDDQVLAFYQHRLGEIEAIIRDHRLVTLPSRPARIRLGTPAENAQQPAPHMVPARLIGNTGEQGEFVLPLGVPGKTEQKYDDFDYDAAAWTLTAHEARPGHELQFARMVETGVSLARAIFARNSVNTEGWGLYAEAITLPFMPDEGKLVSLQLRLQRAARAFLDPELQMGEWTPESARELLMKDVGLSPAFATEEVDRFTFRMPGQATAYYYGYLRLEELRQAVEQREGARFDALAFHDLVLSQGLLPPKLMREVILAHTRGD